MSHCSQTFPGIFIEKNDIWKFEEICEKKEEIQCKGKKEIIDYITFIYWQISIEKYVPEHLISLV